jgi:hypothetical protein
LFFELCSPEEKMKSVKFFTGLFLGVGFLLFLASPSSAQNGIAYSEKSASTNLTYPGIPKDASGFDYDRDGKKDLFLAESSKVVWRQVSRDAIFVPQFMDTTFDELPSGLPTRITGLSVADFNNDGYMDVYVASSYHVNEPTCGHRLLQYVPNPSSGVPHFEDVTTSAGLDAASIGAGNNYTLGGSWADFNGDSFVDLLLLVEDNRPGHQGSNTQLLLQNVPGQGSSRVFEDSESIDSRDFQWEAVCGDINGDHDVDLVIFGQTPQYYLNIEGALYELTSNFLPNASAFAAPWGMGAISDFNNDGKLDIGYAVATQVGFYSEKSISSGESVLGYEWAISFSSGIGFNPIDIAAVDYDLDSRIDLFALSTVGYILRNAERNNEEYTFPIPSSAPNFGQIQFGGKFLVTDFVKDGLSEIYLSRPDDGQFFFKAIDNTPFDPPTNWIGVALEAGVNPILS